jgi:hypothetical protein
VIQLIASADSMYFLTNAFITDVTAGTTQSVIYPSPQHYGDAGDAPWFRATGGGLSTVSTNLNTDHVMITPNRPQHSAGPTHALSINNGATLSGFIVTDQPVVTMSPQSVLASGGQAITLNPYAIGVPPLSYQWRKGGVAMSGATTSSLVIPSATAAAAGSYDLVVTNLYGSTTSKVATVTMDAISVVGGNNYVVDSNPVGPEHDGYNFGATWLASSSDSSGTNRAGVMQFTAANTNQIVVPASANFNSPTGTIMFWMRSAGLVDPLGSPAAVFDRLNGSGLIMVQTSGGSLEIQANNGTPLDIITSKNVSDNIWHHIAFVYQQANSSNVQVYIDGNLDTAAGNAAGWSWNGSQEIELGHSHDSSWTNFNGIIDDVRLYSRPLTAAEVASVHSTDAIVDSSTLNLRLNFDSAPLSGLTLSWQIPGAILQSAPAVTGPYVDISGAASPYAAAAQSAQKFYRYRNPVTSVISNPFLM